MTDVYDDIKTTLIVRDPNRGLITSVECGNCRCSHPVSGGPMHMESCDNCGVVWTGIATSILEVANYDQVAATLHNMFPEQTFVHMAVEGSDPVVRNVKHIPATS